MELLAQILTLYNWGAVCTLLFFLFNIARFFEQRSSKSKKSSTQQKRPYYPFFILPIILFGFSAFFYSFSEPLIAGNLLGDFLRIIGGIILGIAGYSLLNTMMGGRS